MLLSLNYSVITASQQEEYNSYVKSVPKGHVLQSYEWGQVKAATGWEPICLLVKEDGLAVAALSILKRKLPGSNYCIFYAPRGPVADLKAHQHLDFLWQAVAKLAGEHKAIFLKIDPDIPASDQEFKEYLLSRGFQSAQTSEGFEGVQPRFVFRLDLTPSLEQLYANLVGKTRYNVRLAQKKGVEIRVGCTREDLQEFYQVLLETAQRDRFLIRGYVYFEKIWEHLVERGLARLFLADFQGKVIAGTLAFIFGDKTWYLYGASSNQHRNVMPNYLLQWTMIEWAKEQGCTLYDFRGVPGDVGEDHPLYGLVRFKKGFNGIYTEFIGEFDLPYSKFLYWMWNWVEPKYYRGVRQLISLKKRLRGEKVGRSAPAGEI
jgi:lipid II:glycine glycyltransferase (peptidoglycan interpeptide bridge formation enzyme)